MIRMGDLRSPVVPQSCHILFRGREVETFITRHPKRSEFFLLILFILLLFLLSLQQNSSSLFIPLADSTPSSLTFLFRHFIPIGNTLRGSIRIDNDGAHFFKSDHVTNINSRYILVIIEAAAKAVC